MIGLREALSLSLSAIPKIDCLPRCIMAKLPWVEDVILVPMSESFTLVEIAHSYPAGVDIRPYVTPIVEAHTPEGYRLSVEYLEVPPGTGVSRRKRLEGLKQGV